MSAKRPLSAGSGVNALPDWELNHRGTPNLSDLSDLSDKVSPPANCTPQRVSRPLPARKPLRFLPANRPLYAGSGVNALPDWECWEYWEYCGWLVMQSAPLQIKPVFLAFSVFLVITVGGAPCGQCAAAGIATVVCPQAFITNRR